MRVLGIDPGYERLGIAVVEKTTGKERVVFSECFKTDAKLEFIERLELLCKRVRELIKEYQPEKLGIETLFFTTNKKTAMRVAEVRGALLYIAKEKELLIKEINPLEVKVAVGGHGRATKDEVMKMVKMLVEMPDKNKKNSDDELDAIAIAVTALNTNTSVKS